MPKNNMGETMKNRDMISSVAMMLFALWVGFMSTKLTLWSGSLWSGEGPSDGFFPFIGGMLLFIFSLCLFVQNWFKLEKTRTVREPILKRRFFTYIGALLAYTFVINLMGFVLTTLLFIFVICNVAEKISVKKSLIIACISTLCFFIGFQYLLDVPFPPGFLRVLNLG
jgi:putative tricarboxylic transport membrane protein